MWGHFRFTLFFLMELLELFYKYYAGRQSWPKLSSAPGTILDFSAHLIWHKLEIALLLQFVIAGYVTIHRWGFGTADGCLFPHPTCPKHVSSFSYHNCYARKRVGNIWHSSKLSLFVPVESSPLSWEFSMGQLWPDYLLAVHTGCEKGKELWLWVWPILFKWYVPFHCTHTEVISSQHLISWIELFETK